MACAMRVGSGPSLLRAAEEGEGRGVGTLNTELFLRSKSAPRAQPEADAEETARVEGRRAK